MKKILFLLLTLLPLTINAEEYSGSTGECNWYLDTESGVMTISGNGNMGNYSQWDEYKSSIKTVVIDQGVTSIGKWTFSECFGLTSIEISSTVTTIEEGAFAYCYRLTTLEIPSNVTKIATYAFAGCYGLTLISVDKNNLYYNDGDGSNCIIENSTNRLIQGCNTTVIPPFVTGINRYAFYWCNGLTSISFPSSVTFIESQAFLGCVDLSSLEIPSTITNIKFDAFWDCSKLNTISVDTSNPYYNDGNGCNCIIETSTNRLIRGCYSTIIPSTVNTIGWGAFSLCDALTSVEIPSNITNIEPSAFYGCYNLTSLEIPNSVTNIGYSAFWLCTSLTSVKSYIKEPFVFGNGAFDEISSSCILYVPAGTRDAYIAAGWTEDIFKGGIVEMEGSGEEPNDTTVTDLSPYFIVNPHFAVDDPLNTGICTYNWDIRTLGVDYYGSQPLSGWNVLYPSDNQYGVENRVENGRASGVFEIGSGYWIGGVEYVVPTEMSDGSTTGRVLGLVTCWTNSVQYTQPTILPAGTYTLSMSYYNTGGTTSIVKNLIGFIEESGNEHLAQSTTFPVGTWTTDQVQFTLTEQTKGYFSLGYTAQDMGSAYMPHFYTDGISLVYEGNINPVLFALMSAVNTAKAYSGQWFEQNLKSQFSDAINIGEQLILAESDDLESNNAAAQTINSMLDDVMDNIQAYKDLKTFYDDEVIDAFNNYQNTNISGSLEDYKNSINAQLEQEATWTPEEIQRAMAVLPTIIAGYSEEENDSLVVTAYSPTDEKITINKSEEADMSIGLDNDEEIIMVEFYLQLPEGISIVEDEDGYYVADLNRARSNRHILDVTMSSNGMYHFLCYSNNNNALKGNAGELISISLTCDDSVEPGTYQGRITNLTLADSNLAGISLDDVVFDIVITDYMPGDVNGDGHINGLDVIETVNCIMDQPSDSFIRYAADIDKNGTINGMDLVEIVSLVMQQMEPNHVKAREPITENNGQPSVPLRLESNGGNLSLAVESSESYILAQYILRLTDGQTLNDITSDANHVVAYKEIGDNSYAVVCYSMRNEPFASNDKLMAISVEGEGCVSVTDGVFINAEMREFKVAAAVSGEATDISELQDGFRQPVNIYSIGGTLIKKNATSADNLPQGIYLINGKKYIKR